MSDAGGCGRDGFNINDNLNYTDEKDGMDANIVVYLYFAWLAIKSLCSIKW